jgi:hypothetical protein
VDIREPWSEMECVDVSLPLAADFPISWPTLPPFRKSILIWLEDYEAPNREPVRSAGHYYAQSLELEEHTGTRQ